MSSRDLKAIDDDNRSQRSNNMLADELAYLEAQRGEPSQSPFSQFLSRVRVYFHDVQETCGYYCEVLQANPHIIFVAIFVFATLCVSSLSLIFVFSYEEQEKTREAALDLAIDTGDWFSDQLDKAMLPLFTISQFVRELDIFHDLSKSIGPAHQPGSLPFMPPLIKDAAFSHRNVTGVCDDPRLVERFSEIASTVKRQAKMDGILVNIQLAPQAVVCLLHPMINTEDFPPGVAMNNTGAWGHDLLNDPARKFIAEATIPSDGVVIAGPLTLRQCSDCDPLVKKAFIARLPIDMDDQEIVVNNVKYNKWGFAVVLINWNALVERSGVYESFKERGYEFQLTRTDKIVDPDTNESSENVVILAETPNFMDKAITTVSTPLETTNNQWVMTVGFHDNANPAWKVGSITASVLASFCIAVLICTVLAQKQNYTMMKKRYAEQLAQPEKIRLRQYLETEANLANKDDILNSDPIADLFPNTTVLFADIAGFTAWSSEREPKQVFSLLQTVFYSFDRIARKLDVFKIETTGDCYTAVTGLPNPQQDHAERMVKFARQCMVQLAEITAKMEIALGPDTGDLKMRFGLHSGPVTAGVLTGERSRFQVFGETMTIAARMENTGEAGRIQLSSATAKLIVASGGRRCLDLRKDPVQVTGKGHMQTYWVNTCENGKQSATASTEGCALMMSTSSVVSSLWGGEEEPSDTDVAKAAGGDKIDRLVEWHVDSMTKLLKKIISRRRKGSSKGIDSSKQDISKIVKRRETVLDEVAEVIRLPKFDASAAKVKLSDVRISAEVVSQLRDYVKSIASLYHDNPFHNFEHASHVTMSAHKMLNRIVVPEDVNYERKSVAAVASDLHDYTFGITSDPLTHFAVIFSALIHDADHNGVVNSQLAKEKPALANKYRNQSIAEQNSFDIAWDLLMDPHYRDLQKCLFHDESDLLRFRQIVVNIVLATDIFDKELKALREMRWHRAFYSENFPATISSDMSDLDSSEKSLSRSKRKSKASVAESLKLDLKGEDTNRKATIVIEHIIQASDVAHTMQHWQVYKKWNERLFQEIYLAWTMGRAPNNPSEGWYKGELWFYDNYIIPLARKLEECGVFGVASDECLFNAIENRKEWESKGEEIVAEMLARCQESKIGNQASFSEDISDSSGSMCEVPGDADPGNSASGNCEPGITKVLDVNEELC